MTEIIEAWLKGYCQGRVAGYKEGYEKGLFALAPHVPLTVKGMWIDASTKAGEQHFKEDLIWKNLYELCVKNEFATASAK